MSDKVCNKGFTIESIDLLGRYEYDGKLSEDNIKFLQSKQINTDYLIESDAEIIIKFYQSYELIELLTHMSALYNISLIYSDHVMKFNHCKFNSIKSLSNGEDVLVEVKFICESKPGLPVEFEHTKIECNNKQLNLPF
jgi:hypothetical protein